MSAGSESISSLILSALAQLRMAAQPATRQRLFLSSARQVSVLSAYMQVAARTMPREGYIDSAIFAKRLTQSV